MSKSHVILNLHGVGTPQRDLEPNEERYWVSVAQFRQVVDLAASMRDRFPCAFTIDDGNISDATISGPYLAERGFATQIFALTSRIGQPGSLDRHALRDLIAMGHSIGSHGHAHRDWRRISNAQVVEEIHTPKRRLEDMTGQPIGAAALPFGGYNRKVLAEVHRAGFRQVYSSDGGPARGGAWPIGRNSLRCDMSLEQIGPILTNVEPFTIRLKRWIKCEIKKRI